MGDVEGVARTKQKNWEGKAKVKRLDAAKTKLLKS